MKGVEQMKRFVSFVLMLVLCTMTSVVVAEALLGDEYELNPEGWPDRFWGYMTPETVAEYEAMGWQKYRGMLWYDPNAEYAKEVDQMADLTSEKIQDLYNQGYTCHVIYHWLCDGRLLGKHQEQSVYVGRRILSPQEAGEAYATGVSNALEDPVYENTGVEPSVEYYSMWFYNGKEAAEPKDNELDDDNYKFVRIEYDAYDFGYGARLYLRNGNFVEFSLKEILELGSVDYEIVHWN